MLVITKLITNVASGESLFCMIAIDTDGNTHLVWMDGRGYGFDKNVNYEVWYTRMRLRGAGDWNGARSRRSVIG